MKTDYDVVLKEKPLDCGLTRTEVCDMFDMLAETECIPLDIQSEGSAAMGFIGIDCSERIGYDFSNLERMISDVLDDMENETPGCEYSLPAEEGEVTVYLSR